MSHPTDDDLLDLSLGWGGPEAHVRDCPACATRLGALRAEQELLRDAFAMPEVAPRKRRRIGPWLLAAAASALAAAGLGWSVSTALEWRARASRLAAEVAALRGRGPSSEERRFELRGLAQAAGDSREAMLKHPDDRSMAEFAVQLERLERAFVEGLEAAADRTGSMAPDQRARLREAGGRFWRAQLLDEASGADLIASLRPFLTSEQLRACEAHALEETECCRDAAIEELVDELSGELDLRCSVAERVRGVLEASYPKLDAPCFPVEPADALSDEALAVAVRRALEPGDAARFDAFVQGVRDRREIVARALRGRP